MLRLGQDVRYAFRQLTASPTFTIVSILTIALGIGVNTAIFSVMNTILLQYLPVPNPQQLVYFHLKNQPLSTFQSGYGDTSLSLPVFEAMRTRHDVFTDVIGFVPLSFQKVAVRFGAEPEEAYVEMVSGNFFSGLGVRPIIGRGFTTQDETDHAPLAILSYEWWNRRFAGDLNILGQTLFIKGVAFTIIGVAPPRFHDADPGHATADFWVPLQTRPELNPWGNAPSDGMLYGSPNWLCLLMVGRLRLGISPQQATAQLTPAFQRALANASPIGHKEPKPQLVFSDVRGMGNLREEYQHPLHFLMSMVVLVLFIASANIAMLLIARNANRQREFALRRALGAGARVLFFQLLLESSILVAAGAVLGWLFAASATQALTAWSGLDVIAVPDHQVLLFTLGISVVVALVFGLAPMRATASVPLTLALRSATATSNTDRNRFWGRKLVVALQISLCVVLLFAASLLYRTLRNIESRDLGMRSVGLLVFGISPQSNIHTDADAIHFHTNLLDGMRSLPGVESATIMQIRIGSGGSNNDGVLVDGRNPLPNKPFAPMRTNLVGSAFLHTLGISLHLGHDIESSDTATSPKVAVINQTFADRYLPDVNPIGHQISYFNRGSSYTIVGVAQNSRYTRVGETDRPIVYFPFTQVPGISEMQYELRTSGDPKKLELEAAKLVHKVDSNLPLEKPITQQAQFAQTITQERLLANLSVFFGGLAAFLVAVGLYGTVSYSVSRRTMEIGVRMALGAQQREVLWMVLRESTSLAIIGLAVGLPLSIAVARTLRSMLYGLTPSDPVALALALTGITIVTLIASILPARRAASLDPMRALHME